jgi:hypothetical protein
LAVAVVDSMYAHLHDDTPEAIAALIADPRVTASDISKALDALSSGGLAHTDGLHWQLTTAGYRRHREAAAADFRMGG